MTTQADNKTIEVPAAPLSMDEANRIADLFATTPSGWANRNRTTGELEEPKDYAIRPGGVYPLADDAGREVPRTDGRRGTTYEVGPRSYLRYPVLADAVKDLPEGWDQQVHSLLCFRTQQKSREAEAQRRAERLATYEVVEHPAIRAHLIANVDTRGYRETPKPLDLSWMAKLAASDRRQRGTKGDLYGPTPYKPQPGCNAKLHLKQAIRMAFVQDAYADLHYAAIPVTIEEGADLTVCKRNLAAFGEACRTHTGLAGSGSNFDLTLIENEGGVFVLFYERASIAD